MSYYAIVKQELAPSKNGGEMITMTLYDIESREEFRTYIDPNMENFDHWIEIITNPEKGYIVTGLKKKPNYGRYKHEILNADCEPIVVKRVKDVKEMERRMRENWAREDFEKSGFGRLYDVE